jgi:hypothetical protein
MNEPKKYTRSAEVRISWQTTTGVIDGAQEWDLQVISVDINGKPALISDSAATELVEALCDLSDE